MDKEIGCTPCQADGRLPCLTLSSVGAFSNAWVMLPQGQANHADARPQGASAATSRSTYQGVMPAPATKACTRDIMIEYVIPLPKWPARRDSLPKLKNMFLPGQTQEHGELVLGSVRPLHRADVHNIVEPSGAELWLDVRIHTVNPNVPIARELLREEQTKCRVYGQRHRYDLTQLDKGMIPVVFEQ